MAVTVQTDSAYADVDMKAYRDFVQDFVPDQVIDFHVHLYRQEFFTSRLPDVRMAFTLAQEDYCLEEAIQDLALMWPDKRPAMLAFGAPIQQVDIRANNDYIAQCIHHPQVHGLFMPLPDDPADFLARQVKAGGFVGFKPYLDLAKRPAAEVRIPDFVSDAQLEVADQGSLIITLHIPGARRLADPHNIQDIVRAATRAPRACIVLAHAGRAYCDCDIHPGAVEALRGLSNVYFDLALVHSEDLIEVLLRACGPQRMIFGTDLPAGADHGKNICINDQHYYVFREYRSWGLTPQAAVAARFTFYAYETVRAVKIAAERVGLSRSDIDDIFFGNAQRLMSEARKYVDTNR